IRDRNVTGVQTCALPIFLQFVANVNLRLLFRLIRGIVLRPPNRGGLGWELGLQYAVRAAIGSSYQLDKTSRPICRGCQYRARGRSEERRVGKEWRWRRGR